MMRWRCYDVAGLRIADHCGLGHLFIAKTNVALRNDETTDLDANASQNQTTTNVYTTRLQRKNPTETTALGHAQRVYSVSKSVSALKRLSCTQNATAAPISVTGR